MREMKPRFRERAEVTRTRVTKVVFPGTTNSQNTLFGGTAMQWMDEVAYIAATRFSRQTMVTVCMDRVEFQVPIPEGTIVELVATVSRVGNTSLGVIVDVFLEEMFAESRVRAIQGELTFVAVGDDGKPTRLSIHGGGSKT